MVWVATADGIRRIDGSEERTELGGRRVQALAAEDGRLWSLVEEREVHCRSEAGWTPVGRRDAGGLTCLLPLPGAGGALVGLAGAHLARVDGRASQAGSEAPPPDTRPAQIEAVPSFDRAPDRDRWYTPWGGPPDTRSLAQAGDGTLYVNVHVGGILASADGGRTWAATIEIDADVHQVCCPRAEEPGLVLAACADGLAVSSDAGKTWLLREVGLRRPYSRSVAVAGDTVLVSASDGPGGSHAAVYRAPLEGLDRFERCRRGLPGWFEGNVDTGWLGATDDTAAFVTADGRLYQSRDEGATWAQAADGLTAPGWLVVG